MPDRTRTPEQACPPLVLDLVERFGLHRDTYRQPAYNETQVRREFVDPLFKALGWDIDNEQGHAEAYKDVIHEDAIKVGGSTKAPDYCFRIGGVRKFFVEAKKPAEDIKQKREHAYQLRRYAWTAKLPLSILTDFEEFAVFDCTKRPRPTDKASAGRVLYVTCDEYPDRWGEIASVFSKDAILKGSFDKFAATARRKRGTAEVDDEFLKEIESWRDELARNVALRNPNLSTRDLNYAVTKTIDRMIFLRMCEDRGVETYAQLRTLLNGTAVYPRLVVLFRRADERYNSGLFHFEHERDRVEAPDELTPTLVIDDRVLKDIIKRLYYPECPYEFSVMPPEILGQVYEQFLGKVITLTAGHRAKIEFKPEVRKAGGVYYTPKYIVDYIVENTVGKLLEGKAPSDVGPMLDQRARTGRGRVRKSAGSTLSILDPACGSGSFLLGAYQCLLDWHLRWYAEHDPDDWGCKKSPPICQSSKPDPTGNGTTWRLTIAERKRILLNGIYGVDIDPHAVEVTKLSLLLKVLEGESQQSLDNQLRLFHERALPDLGSNIKCGNSLIAPDFYESQQLDLFNEEERYRINAFDWHTEFPEVFKKDGFDAVIGNPPYGFHQIHAPYAKDYFKDHFKCVDGSFEHYFLFYEGSLKLLREGGLHGFIVPVTWLTIPSARALRQLILDHYAIRRIAWLPELVFANAQVNTLVSIIQHGLGSLFEVEIHESLGFSEPPKATRHIPQAVCVDADYYIGIFEDVQDTHILQKIAKASEPLAEFARPCSGYNPYEVGKGEKPGGGPHTKATVQGKPYHSESKLGDEWKPEVIGRDLGRYSIRISGRRWIRYGPWLAAPRDPQNFQGPRILVQEIVGGKERRLVATYHTEELYHSRDVIPIKVDKAHIDPRFLLGVINSRLLSWYHHKRNPKAKKGLFPKVLVSDLQKLPVCIVDPGDQEEASKRERMLSLVQRMLDLHKALAAARTPSDKTAFQRQIGAIDRQIDQLVYELYNLTDDEIRIVEEATP